MAAIVTLGCFIIYRGNILKHDPWCNIELLDIAHIRELALRVNDKLLVVGKKVPGRHREVGFP